MSSSLILNAVSLCSKIYKTCKNHVNIPSGILNLGRERHTINQFGEMPLFYGLLMDDHKLPSAKLELSYGL